MRQFLCAPCRTMVRWLGRSACARIVRMDSFRGHCSLSLFCLLVLWQPSASCWWTSLIASFFLHKLLGVWHPRCLPCRYITLLTECNATGPHAVVSITTPPQGLFPTAVRVCSSLSVHHYHHYHNHHHP